MVAIAKLRRHRTRAMVEYEIFVLVKNAMWRWESRSLP